LADLWNRASPDRDVVRPLNPHEFDVLVIGRIDFDRRGLIVAEQNRRIVGSVHAGFGPRQPLGPSHRLDRSMGAVAMLLVDPMVVDPGLERGLMLEAERYLRGRGAQVLYAGGQAPVNPFYWGIYGGSEFAGILDTHASFRGAATRLGYAPAATTTIFELDFARGEIKDPRALLFRRQFRLEMTEDVLPNGWWQALSIGLFRPTLFQLIEKPTSQVVAHATTWDIASGYGIADGRTRVGLIEVEVDSRMRRKGYGRHMLSEILRIVRGRSTEVVSVQTSLTNEPALGLYRSLGFEPVGASTLYRLPAELTDRSENEAVEDGVSEEAETL
jgi:ribosomal protein S18 acetylase RimI-like enzyme